MLHSRAQGIRVPTALVVRELKTDGPERFVVQAGWRDHSRRTTTAMTATDATRQGRTVLTGG
ncbi:MULTISPECIES: hypothetical protein [unclassified Streptomyces]|uniref:hypothetical protein n=1 Tax=unclassified Streptomyces TaxID=2593676 RepID=UPI0036E9ADFD